MRDPSDAHTSRDGKGFMSDREATSRLVYPNPFNPSGLAVDLPADGLVTLQIFDESGKELAIRLENQFFPEGSHHIEFYNARGEVRWDAGRPQGKRVYFYRLTVDAGGHRQTDTKKIVLE